MAHRIEDPKIERMVSLHESFHHDLNVSTSFGMALTGWAMLGLRDGKREVEWMMQMMAALKEARGVHERFATFLSLTVIMEEYGGQVEHYLDDHGPYLGYYRDLERLTAVMGSSTFMRVNMALAICYLCFQAPLVLSCCQKKWKPCRDIISLSSPERRFETIVKIHGQGGWNQWFEQAERALKDLPLWSEVLRMGIAAPTGGAHCESDCDELSESLIEHFYGWLRGKLLQHGHDTLEWNGHQAHVDSMIETITATAPEGGIEGAFRSPKAEAFDSRLELFAHEVFENLPVKPLLSLRSFGDGTWRKEEYHLGVESPYLHISLFNSEYVRSSFEIKEGGYLLGNLKHVVMLRTRDTTGVNQQAVVFQEPDELARFICRETESTIIALAHTGPMMQREFAEKWLPLLFGRCFVAALFNHSPFAQLQNWVARQALTLKSCQLEYSQGTMYREAAAFLVSDFRTVFLFAGSLNQTHALHTYIEENESLKSHVSYDAAPFRSIGRPLMSSLDEVFLGLYDFPLSGELGGQFC
jgi:hypothetical protein